MSDTRFAITLGKLLADIQDYLRRYLAWSSNAQVDAVTLWVAHTYVFDQSDQTPYLAITSAEKRSGKSLLLSVLSNLVANPWEVIQPSEAVLFRKIAKSRPTLLLDEVDTMFGAKAPGQEPIRAVLNAGNRRGSKVSRCVAKNNDHDVEDFSVYCPKAIAGIGKLPDTVADRSIPIRLVRRAKKQRVERFRNRAAEFLARDIRDRLEAWADTAELYDHEPPVPEELHDRAADAWEPLVAIADLAGSNWSDRGRRAAVQLSGEGLAESSIGVTLLTDIRDIFEGSSHDAMFSEEVVAELVAREESPWGDWRTGQFTVRTLARLLRPFEIQPKTVRRGSQTLKGYERKTFIDAWDRYVPEHPSEAVGQSSHRHTGDQEDPRSALNAADSLECDGVTFEAPVSNGGEEVAAPEILEARVADVFPGAYIESVNRLRRDE